MEKITFQHVARAFGMDENECRIALASPPVIQEVIHARAATLGEMILKRDPAKDILPEAAITKTIMNGEAGVVCLIGTRGASLFPFLLPLEALAGNKDKIIQQLRRVERQLPSAVERWKKVTRNGTKTFPSISVLLRVMESAAGK